VITGNCAFTTEGLVLLCYKIDSLWWIFLALGSRSG
jgi:hypothetical protein